jgi:tRNA dimethylallyltransferase
MLPVLIVAGPTCSGKSALALLLAQRLNGVIINADSMQVYRELRIVTARPSVEDEAAAPHRLYGVRPAAEPGSVAWWCQAARAELSAAWAAGRLPILCGGTGMYFAALREGLAAVPEVGEAARAEARGLLAAEGAAALHARLAAADPATAAGLRPSDGQRVARAWEVWVGTGRGLADWQAVPVAGGGFRAVAVRLDPPREDLRAAIAGRFGAMLAAGALEEVRALRALGLDPSLPAMRAHGVPELIGFLQGDMTLAAASARAAQVTGQYTKRQATWFRHHDLAAERDTHTIHARFTNLEQFSEQKFALVENFIRERVDATGAAGLIRR